MNKEKALAEYLNYCRESATRVEVAEHERPLRVADGYRIQHVRHGLLGDQHRAGYKIGCTTAVMQRFLDIDQPCAGTVRREDIHASGVRIVSQGLIRPAVECEIAVRIRETPAQLSASSVRAAIGAVMPSIEIVDDRYLDYSTLGVATLVADDFFHAGLVLGEETAFDGTLDLAALGGRLSVNDVLYGSGRGADILGDPINALLWLGQHLAQFGQQLAPGDIVSLGSVVETYWTQPGDKIHAEFDVLGSVACSFA